MSDTDSGWLVEPPSADAALVRIDIADTSELTPELRQALEALVAAMEEVRLEGEPSEVEAFGRRCPARTVCSPETTSPCVSKVIIDCVITKCPRAFAMQ
jgi:hypothetical protein